MQAFHRGKKFVAVNVKNEDITIELDEKLSPSKNIEKYYKLYKKGQKAIETAVLQIEKSKNEFSGKKVKIMLFFLVDM